MIRGVVCLITFIAIVSVLGKNDLGLQRQKRYILFTSGGTYKLVIGVAIPLNLPKYYSLGFVLNMQFIHSQLQNLSQIAGGYPPTIPIRRRRESETNNEQNDRAFTYMALESLMENHGINGRECLLRTICDNAMHNLQHPANGLYGQLLDIILTPEYEYEDGASVVDTEYLDARKAGEYGVDCISIYPGCPLGDGILDMISVLE